MPRRQNPNVKERADGWYFRLRAPEGYPGPGRPRFGPFKTERDAERAGWKKLDEFEAWDPAAPKAADVPSLDEYAVRFLDAYDGATNSKRTLSERLAYARRSDLGPTRLDQITSLDVQAWRATLPPRSAWGIHKALSQVFNDAIRHDVIRENPARKVTNREPSRDEIRPFEYLRDVEAVADELPERFRVIPMFAALTGLRPEEWIPLRRRDLDLKAGLVHVRRVYTAGEMKTSPEKGKGARRAVPLPSELVDLMSGWPMPLDLDGLIFPAERGGLLDLHRWRRHDWNPAVESAGLALCKCGHASGDHGVKPRRPECSVDGCLCDGFTRAKGSPTPYTLRHTYAAHMIAAGVPTDTLARYMGTSVSNIETTYGHLLRDSAALVRALADEYLAKLREREAERPAQVL